MLYYEFHLVMVQMYILKNQKTIILRIIIIYLCETKLREYRSSRSEEDFANLFYFRNVRVSLIYQERIEKKREVLVSWMQFRAFQQVILAITGGLVLILSL